MKTLLYCPVCTYAWEIELPPDTDPVEAGERCPECDSPRVRVMSDD